MTVGAETPTRPVLTEVEAQALGGPKVGELIKWRPKDPRPGRKKISEGRVEGYDGDTLIVSYRVAMGRGAFKEKRISVSRDRLIDES